MDRDPIRGRVLRLTFLDGPMANRTVEHVFDRGGGVAWRLVAPESNGKLTAAKKCEIVPAGEGVWAVSYLSESGYTLTVVLDFRTRKLVAFSSNERDLGVQHGTFQPGVDDLAESVPCPPNGTINSIH